MIAESKEITVKAADGGSFSAYMALPKTTPAPAIIVITSIFGTDQEMRDLVDRYAEAGFIGIVPDIFWRIEPGPLSHTDEQQRQRAYARMKAFDVDKGVSDIKSIAEMLTSMKEYNGKFAVAGFCFGGRYAFLSATRLGATAAVAFHGTAIGQELGEASKATCPMSLHLATTTRRSRWKKSRRSRRRSSTTLRRRSSSIPGHSTAIRAQADRPTMRRRHGSRSSARCGSWKR